MPDREKLEDKFEYFYRPYNYACNTAKFISYEFETANPFKAYADLLKEENFIDEYLKSLCLAPFSNGQYCAQKEMQKRVLEFRMQLLSN